MPRKPPKASELLDLIRQFNVTLVRKSQEQVERELGELLAHLSKLAKQKNIDLKATPRSAGRAKRAKPRAKKMTRR